MKSTWAISFIHKPDENNMLTTESGIYTFYSNFPSHKTIQKICKKRSTFGSKVEVHSMKRMKEYQEYYQEYHNANTSKSTP